MIATVRMLRRPGLGCSPQIFVMIPPPVLMDGAFDIQERVVNVNLPLMVRAIAADAYLPESHVVDLFSLFGGFRETATDHMPTRGCPAPGSTYDGCRLFYDSTWGDGVHPADEGFQLIANATLAAMRLAGIVDSKATDAHSAAGDVHEDAAGEDGEWTAAGPAVGPTDPNYLGCFQDGNGSAYPVLHHWWTDPSIGKQLGDLPRPDAALCQASCAAEGYDFAGLIWGGADAAGASKFQCFCSTTLGEFERDPSRRLPDYKCCPVCLNYGMGSFPDPPCAPDLFSCGAWMTLSAFYVGKRGARPCLPPPPVEPPRLNNPCRLPFKPYEWQPWCAPLHSRHGMYTAMVHAPSQPA